MAVTDQSMRPAVPGRRDAWGSLAWGPETDVPCTDCESIPTRALSGCRGYYCMRHTQSYDTFGMVVVGVLLLAVFVGLPLMLVGFALGWFPAGS